MTIKCELGNINGSIVETANSWKQTYTKRILEHRIVDNIGTRETTYVKKHYNFTIAGGELRMDSYLTNQPFSTVDQPFMQDKLGIGTLKKILGEDFDLLQELSCDQMKIIANFCRYGRGNLIGETFIQQGELSPDGVIMRKAELNQKGEAKDQISIPIHSEVDTSMKDYYLYQAGESLQKLGTERLTTWERITNLRDQVANYLKTKQG